MPIIGPQGDGTLTFPAAIGGPIVFKVVESKESRSLRTGYQLVYDVFMDPPHGAEFNQHLFGDIVKEVGDLSDEVIIGWNTFDYAGWTFFDRALIKKWPPTCVRVGHNAYKVTINYAPLNIVNFQIATTKTKRKFGRETIGWAWDSDYAKFKKADVPPSGPNKTAIAFRAINVDESSEIQGTDVIEPSFTWTERWTWGPYEYLAAEGQSPGDQYGHYFMMMTYLSGTVNAYPFRGCEPGTVLFCGGAGRNVQPYTWEIDYRFSFKPKREKQEFCGIDFDIPTELERFMGGHVFIDSIYPKKGIPVELHGKNYILHFPDMVKFHLLYPLEDFAPLKLCSEVKLGSTIPLNALDDIPEIEGKAECKIRATENL